MSVTDSKKLRDYIVCSCLEKVLYYSKTKAENSMIYEGLEVYHCPICKFYHHGHKSNNIFVNNPDKIEEVINKARDKTKLNDLLKLVKKRIYNSANKGKGNVKLQSIRKKIRENNVISNWENEGGFVLNNE